MKKVILNRKNLKIVTEVQISKNSLGTAIVMHGLGGFKEQLHIQTFAKAFKKSGFTVVIFDTTNSIGESEGKFENATMTSYYQDLEDVVAWVEKQTWYKKPLVLSGHSLGGFSVAFYGENYPEKVDALAPISPVVSGKLSLEAHMLYEPEEAKKWEQTGWQVKESSSKPGVIKKLPWSHMEDRMKYNLVEKIDKLKMPILLIVGEKDISTPANHVQFLYDKLSGKNKELHIIKGAPHTFVDTKQLEQIEEIFVLWIKKIIRE